MMSIILHLFAVGNFAVVGLLDYLPTFLLARGKEVLNGDIVLGLDLYMLLLIESVLHYLTLLHGLDASLI